MWIRGEIGSICSSAKVKPEDSEIENSLSQVPEGSKVAMLAVEGSGKGSQSVQSTFTLYDVKV